MKIVILFLLSSLSIYAQDLTSKGSISIGGKISFASSHYEKPSRTLTLFDISPQASIFLIEHLETGIFISYQSEKTEDYKTTSTAIGPFLNYYITTRKIKPFGGIAFSYMNSGDEYIEYDGSHSSYNYSRYSFSFIAGILIPVSDHLAVQPFIQTTYLWSEHIPFGEYNQFLFGVSIKAFL